MEWEFYPNYDEIKSDISFDIFQIKFLLIYENELTDINKIYDTFKILKYEVFNGKKILLLEKNKNKHILFTNINEINTCKMSISLLECIKSKKINFYPIESEKMNLIRVKDSSYVIHNHTENKVNYIFPFFNDKNWYLDGKLYTENNFFVSIEIKPNSSVSIQHKQNILLYLKFLSFVFLLAMFLLIIYECYKKNRYFSSKI